MIIFCLTNLANAATKTKVIWIDEEPEFSSSNERELKKRIRKLERAVAQLQRQVFNLEYKDSVPAGTGGTEVKEKKFTCYLETPFEGLFSETRESLTEAKAAAAKTCSEKTKNSLYCKIEKATCGE